MSTSAAPDGTSGADSRDPRVVRRTRWWVSAVTFVLGIGVGVVATGLLTSGVEPLPANQGGAGPAPTTGPGAAGNGGLGVQAQINDACLRVINDAQDTYGIINGVGQAAADLDFAQLDVVVRRLQPLQPRLESNLAACNVTTRLADGEVAPSASQAPSTAPATPPVTATAGATGSPTGPATVPPTSAVPTTG